MGTRSVTRFWDGDEPVLALYRQFDGYPTGMGADLKETMTGLTEGNGIPLGANLDNFFNGAPELPLLVIHRLKRKEYESEVEIKKQLGKDSYRNPTKDQFPRGNYYITKFTTNYKNDCWIEFTYDVHPQGPGKPILIKCAKPAYKKEPEKILYEGPVEDFDPEVAEKAAWPEDDES